MSLPYSKGVKRFLASAFLPTYNTDPFNHNMKIFELIAISKISSNELQIHRCWILVQLIKFLD